MAKLNKAKILDLFDTQTRTNPSAHLGLVREWADGVLRCTGSYNLIAWWDPNLRSEDVDSVITAQTVFFRSLNERVEWKVYSHDRPANVEERLDAAGWQADEVETFLVFDLEYGDIPAKPTPGVNVRRVRDHKGLEDYVTASSAAFECDQSHWSEMLKSRLHDPTLVAFVAYADETPVASGRLELIPGTAFAGIYGGGTAPTHRNRGVYAALVAARADEARSQGYRYLTVDALKTSQPILLQIGFEAVATVRGWILNR